MKCGAFCLKTVAVHVLSVPALLPTAPVPHADRFVLWLKVWHRRAPCRQSTCFWVLPVDGGEVCVHT